MASHTALMVLSALAGSRALSLAKAFSIEIRAIGRQEHQPRARRFDCVANTGCFVRGQIVHHDDIACRQGRNEHLFDMGEE